ncbi:MAG: hypothetical protein CVV50_05535 [Spirochaetae bacterium HGW-Spirochaetae-6]|jgi:hypothetical protein|nr:MAG: hypothetical protein CVV50_05535 [Spirochaetae bacterium HGW-Spirochaetae-6]
MRKSKTVYWLICLLFLPITGSPFSGGFSLGGSFDAWEANAFPTSEMSNFLLEMGGELYFRPSRRMILFPRFGMSLNSSIPSADPNDQFQYYYAGARIGWLIHPDYAPFIGGGLYLRYYDKILDKESTLAGILSFCGGARILNMSSSSVWFVLEVGLLSTLYEDYFNSSFSLSFSLLFDFASQTPEPSQPKTKPDPKDLKPQW